LLGAANAKGRYRKGLGLGIGLVLYSVNITNVMYITQGLKSMNILYT